MTKRLLASLLAVLMVVSMIPLTAFAATEAGGEVPSSPTATIDATAGKWEDTAYKVEFEENAEAIDAVKGITDDNTAVFSVTEEKLVDASSDVTEVAFAEANNESNTKASLTLTFSEALIEDTVYYLVITVNGQESIVKITVPDSQVEITSVELTLGDVVVGSALPEAEVSTVMAGETEVEKGQGVTVTTAWKKGQEEASGSAEEGVEYTATITVEAAEGYKLSETVSYKLDGENATPDKDGNITKTVTAAAAGTEKTNLSTATVELENAESITYDGTAKEPSVTVSIGQDDDKVELTENTDYTVKYSNNTNVGNATITVTAVEGSEYTGTATGTFEIKKGTVTVTWEPSKDSTEYTGSKIDIGETFGAATAKIGDNTIAGATITYVATQESKDAEFKNAGEYKVVAKVAGTANYDEAQSSEQTLTISKKTISVTADDWSDVTGLVYNGEDRTPALEVDEAVASALEINYKTTKKDDSTEINDGVKDAGEYTTTATVELKSEVADNYTLEGLQQDETSLELTKDWSIGKAPLAGTVTIDAGSGEVKDGSKLTASVEWSTGPVKSEEPVLTYQWKKGNNDIADATTNEYEISSGQENDVFTVEVSLSADNEVNANYELDLTNTASVKFGATSLTGATVTLSADSFDYNTQVQKPTVEKVEVGESESLTEVAAENYEVTYSDVESTNAGNYNVIITGKGDYTGSVTKPYSIKQVDATADKTTVSVAAEANNTVTVTTDGEVSATSTATSTATVSVSGNVVTITGVAAGETTVAITAGAGTNYKATEITVNVTVTAADDTDTPTVSITGTAKVGQTLTAEVTGAAPEAEKTYKWYRDDELIADATAETYTLVEADEGKTIKVGVTIGDAAEIKSDGVGPVASASASDPSVSQTEVSVKASSTTTVTVTGGEITNVESADESIATATFSGQTVTISGVAAGGPVDITITTAASDDYTAGSLTVAVTVTAAGGSTNPGYNPGTGSGTTTPNPTPSTSPDPTTPPAPTPEPPKATVEPTVEGDTASGTVSGDTITDLIEEAGNDGAGEVVVEVKPSGTDAVDVVKTELPAGSMKDLADAKVDLTVSTPVADVTLPQETLKELGAGEGPVTVTAAQTDTGTAGAPATTITVTVEQGGAAVEAGVTATVPADVVSNMAGNSNGTVTVSTPVADVVLPNSTLTAAGKNDVSVSAVPTANGTSIEVKRNGVTMTNASVQVAVPVPETSDDSTVAYIVDANGNKTILPKSVAADGEMKVLLDTGKATITYQNNAKTFTDSASVPGWAKSSFTTSRELIKGIDNGNGGMAFRPNKTTTRAELVTMLHRLESEPTVGNVNFDDMKGNEWYKDAAAWAQTKGVVNGTDKGFEGNKTITRQELATMLYRYMQNVTGYKGKTGDYSGIAGGDKVNSWAAEAMRWAYGSGIITGKSDSAGNTNLDPAGLATRAEVSAMLERFVKLIAA